MVDGVLYVTAPDNVWALDVPRWSSALALLLEDERRHAHRQPRRRACGVSYLFFVTPDNYLISLEAKTGKERWRKELASFQQQYFHTMAPMVIDNHVLVGSSNDLDRARLSAVVRSRDGRRCSGSGTPRRRTRASQGSRPGRTSTPSSHGGGHPWVPGAYDPETRLYIIGTGNPTPAYTSAPRGEGLENLFTCALVAIHVDTGKMAWYYQTSPHDTHDWDSAQTPVFVDGEFNGRPAQDGRRPPRATATSSSSIGSPASTC